MAIEMVRIPSETPNISNIDDFVGLRYAYGNQNGYVIDKGNECSYTINGSIFKVNSGRLVLQGVECDIDANGISISIDNVSTKRFYTIYLQVNLSLNEVKILSIYDTATYPVIDAGDNLTQNTIGSAKMALYNFDATNGVISNVNKVIKSIKYTEDIDVKNSKNVSEQINGKDISSIFEKDGLTVKKSTQSKNSTNADNGIVVSDGTYSSLKKDKNTSRLKDSTHFIRKLRPIFENQNYVINSNSQQSISTDEQLGNKKLLIRFKEGNALREIFICGTGGSIATPAYSTSYLATDGSINFYSIIIYPLTTNLQITSLWKRIYVDVTDSNRVKMGNKTAWSITITDLYEVID